jgi:hypothetical protein
MKAMGLVALVLGILLVAGELSYSPDIGPGFLFGLALVASGMLLVGRARRRMDPPPRPLPARPPPADRRQHSDGLVTVLETSDPGLVGVAESLLEEADIEFIALNEDVQDVIGLGRVGGLNVAAGPVRLQVAGERAADARALLKDLEVPH